MRPQLKLHAPYPTIGGHGCYSTFNLKQCAGSITPLVYHLFNLCISSYSLPEEWRLHLIVPVHKSGPKTDKKLSPNFSTLYPLQSYGKVDTQQDRQHCNKTDFSTAIWFHERKIIFAATTYVHKHFS